MKVVKRIVYIITLLCCLVAIWMQISVSGENLLTMDSQKGYLLAVSYRWVTLAAVILAAISLLIAVLGFLRKRKGTENKVPKKEKRNRKKKQEAAAQAMSPAPPVPPIPSMPSSQMSQVAGTCMYCGAELFPGQRVCPRCGREPVELNAGHPEIGKQ